MSYTPHYGRLNPMPLYYHPCGQEIGIGEISVGYQVRFQFWVGGRVVSHCPLCGKRLTFCSLIHPDEFLSWEDYQDERDTMRSLEPAF